VTTWKVRTPEPLRLPTTLETANLGTSLVVVAIAGGSRAGKLPQLQLLFNRTIGGTL
jgi:hypothetical protein